MHDEDCAIGLSVRNPGGEWWTCYGDKRALDEVAADNLKRCVAAVQASADEIYTAYTSKTIPSSSNYKAWTIAPTSSLRSARKTSRRSSSTKTLPRRTSSAARSSRTAACANSP